MRANKWDDGFMTATIDSIATRYLETLFEVKIEHELAVEQLKARAVDLQAWAEIFVTAKPKVCPWRYVCRDLFNVGVGKRCCQRSQWCTSSHVYRQAP